MTWIMTWRRRKSAIQRLKKHFGQTELLMLKLQHRWVLGALKTNTNKSIHIHLPRLNQSPQGKEKEKKNIFKKATLFNSLNLFVLTGKISFLHSNTVIEKLLFCPIIHSWYHCSSLGLIRCWVLRYLHVRTICFVTPLNICVCVCVCVCVCMQVYIYTYVQVYMKPSSISKSKFCFKIH